MKLWLYIVGIIICVAGGVGFRMYKLNELPFPGTSLDEYSYSWVGLSLIKTGMPVGISGIPGYQHQLYQYINVDRVYTETARGNPVAINWPWFDHPPLMGLVTGGFAYLKGARVFEETTVNLIRKPMVALGGLSILGVIVVGTLWYGKSAGLLAGALYATSPLIIFGSRMIQAENGMIPCFLWALVFLELYFSRKSYTWLAFAGILAGVAFLFKVSGVVVAVSMVVILLLRARKTFKGDVGFFGMFCLPFWILFLIYGVSIDGVTFFKIFFSNADRFYGIGSEALLDLFTKPRLTHDKFLMEPLVISGWIAYFISLAKSGKNQKLKTNIIVVALYMGTYLFFGSWPYGWYTFPFWPFIFIILSYVIVRDIRKGSLVPVLLGVIPVGYLITRIITIHEFQKYAQIWRLIWILLLGSFIIKAIWPKNTWSKKILQMGSVVLVLGTVILNVVYFRNIDISAWYKLF